MEELIEEDKPDKSEWPRCWCGQAFWEDVMELVGETTECKRCGVGFS